MIVEKSTTIEEIAGFGSALVQYLSEKGIRCIRCGEPIWGTLEEAAAAKNFSHDEIENFVSDMNLIISKK